MFSIENGYNDTTVVPMLKTEKITRNSLVVACSKTIELKPHTSAMVPYLILCNIEK